MSGSMMLKKKPVSSGSGGGLRINKLSVTSKVNGGGDHFDEVEEDAEASPTAAPVVTAPAPVVVAPPVVLVPSPVAPPAPTLSGVDKLKAMNTDFFSGL